MITLIAPYIDLHWVSIEIKLPNIISGCILFTSQT